MNRRIQFFVFNFSLFVSVTSCNEKITSETPKDKEKNAVTDSSHAEKEKLSHSDTILITSPFESLVSYMDSLGYDPDTTYFDEKMYQDGKIHYSNYETNYVHEILTHKGSYGDLTIRAYLEEYDLNFSKVKDILIYPWRIPDSLGRRRFGEVQCWTFENVNDAKYVYEFLEYENENNGFPFINTESYYFRCGNEVFIFNAFRNDVDTRQRQFYIWMKNKCDTTNKNARK